MGSDYTMDNTNELGQAAPAFVVKTDPRILILKEGHELRLRLLRFYTKLSARREPWITKFVHTVFSKNEDGTFTSHFTVCPTTQYLNIQNAQAKCKVCKAREMIDAEYIKVEQLDAKKAQYLAKTAKTIKRKFKAFFPVYIFSDNLNPENDGKVKLLMIQSYGDFKRIYEFLHKVRQSGAELVGKYFNNLNTLDASDLMLRVSESNVFEVKMSFAKAETYIQNFDETMFLEDCIDPLKFDSEFFSPFDSEKHDDFFTNYIEPLIARNLNRQTRTQSAAPTEDPGIRTLKEENGAMTVNDEPVSSTETEEAKEQVAHVSEKVKTTNIAPPPMNSMNLDEIDAIINEVTHGNKR